MDHGRAIPNFVVAESPNGLRRKMLLKSAQLGGFVPFTDIQFAQGKWWAWYQPGLHNPEELPTDEVVKGSK